MRSDRPNLDGQPADPPRRRPLADLRERLARLGASHPSAAGFDAPDDDDSAPSKTGGLRRQTGDSAEKLTSGDEPPALPGDAKAGQQAGQGREDVVDRLDRLDRLARLLGADGRSHRPAGPDSADEPAGADGLAGPGRPGPYRPWFASDAVSEPWFSPDQRDRSD